VRSEYRVVITALCLNGLGMLHPHCPLQDGVDVKKLLELRFNIRSKYSSTESAHDIICTFHELCKEEDKILQTHIQGDKFRVKIKKV